jgi:putative ABC transport system permease protein
VLARYVWRDLVRNPRRSLAALTGISLGIGLFSAVLFFIDGSSASMAQRAVAPLPIDVQRVLTAPLGGRLRLTETADVAGRLAPGQRETVRLVLVNDSTSAANEVVLRSEPPAGLAYVRGSATVDGAPVPSGATDNPFAQGTARTGLNLGTISSGATVLAAYEVEARGDGAAGDGPGFRTSFSSREVVAPVPANAPEPLGLAELATRIAHVDGVASADQLSFLDLPGGSVSAGATRLAGSLRLFGFDAGYQRRHADINVVAGAQAPGEAMISVEAAERLGVRTGDTVALEVPGAAEPLELVISGEVDLRRARALFFSRQGSNLEDFLYAPNSVVIDPATFQRDVVPAVLAGSAARGSERNLPVREVDVQLRRDRLDADPGTALEQTRRIAADVQAIAPEQDYLIDNISNTLDVAREDAALAKRMFLFLGVPGGALAAILAGYAGAVLASAQRREQAILRVRGAARSHLVRMLALRSTLLTAAGAMVGLAIGLLSAVAVLGVDALSRASVSSLIVSGIVGAVGGFLATGSALYVAGRTSIRREINEERALLCSRPPPWWRLRLDLLAGLGIGALCVVAARADAFAGVPGSVYEGRGVRLQLWLLALPLAAWFAGSLVGGRSFVWLLSRERGRTSGFPHLIGGVVSRSLRRRSWAAAQGMVVVALVVGMATSITAFTASYDRAKAADARFTLGSDIKVVPEPTGSESAGSSFAEHIESVPGISAATPVVYGVENGRVHSARDEDAANVAAVDPLGFLRVADLRDDDFVGSTAGGALTDLSEDPTGALLSAEMADFLSVTPGDSILVLFAQGTDAEATSEMHVLGLFRRLPGFPDGADVMVNLVQLERLIPSTVPDFFLVRTADGKAATLHSAVSRLSSGLGSGLRTAVETRENTLATDQSSLAALNIRGLLTLDLGYALAMAIVAVGIFVFGLLLQRRREYVTMRAQGVHTGEIRAVIVLEAGIVTVAACLAGVVVGAAMAVLLVNVLRPLFVLTPHLVFPVGGILGLVLLLVASTVAAAVAASALVGRLKATELLRDE